MRTLFNRIASLSTPRIIAVVIALLACTLPLAANAAVVADRITAPLSSSPLATVKGNVPGRAKPAYDQGRLSSTTLISGVRLVFQPSAAQQADLDALLAAQHDPTSPLYHQWITPEQYADRFGLSQNDVASVTSWLASQGLTVNSIAPSRNSITFSGTAVQIEQALKTELHSYVVNGVSHFSNATSPSLPSAIVGMVAGIQGLDDFFPHPQSVKAPTPTSAATANLSTVSSHFTSSESGNHYITPADFATIYNVGPLYTANYTGTGQKIAIAGQTSIYTTDITAYRSAASLPALNYTSSLTGTAPYLSTYCVSTNTSYCTVVSESDLPEADLDVELSSGVAYNANIIYVYDPQGGVFNAYEYAISHNVAPIVSVSYGTCEDYDLSNNTVYNASTATALRVFVQEGNSQGQTTIAASGDSGAADCDYNSGSTVDSSAIYGLQVDIPADIPEVTAMGGTEFYPDAEATCTSGGCLTGGSTNSTPSVFSTTTYWTGTASSTDVLSTALSYIPEAVWNDDSASIAAGDGFSAGGGGISQVFSKPTWQVALTTPADTASSTITTQRDVPDLALSASPAHDAYLVCTQKFNNSGTQYEGSSCTSGFRYGLNGGLTAYGGTSVAAPSFAGILALIEQRNNTTYGNVNTLLYSLAGGSNTYANDFHDVVPVSSPTFGANNNDDPCTSGHQNCSTGGSIGYSTLVGYDLATGLGSVNAYNLAANASSLTPSVTTLTYTPSTVTTLTSPVTLKATITSGVNTVLTTPTGTVTFTVNGYVLPGGPYTLVNGTVSATTSFPNGGAQTILVTYSGDTNFIGSSSTTTLNVASSGSAVTSLMVTPTPNTVVMGQSFVLNTSITSTTSGNITGTVTYKIGTNTIGTANVTATTGNSGTAATITIVPSTALGFVANASNTITATYAGNATYAASTNTTAVNVSGIPTFTVSATPMTITSTSNGSLGTTTVTVTSVNGYSGTLYTPCTTATENNISISPNTLDLYYNCAAAPITNSATISQVSLTSGTTATFPLTFDLSTVALAQPGTALRIAAPTQTSKLALFGGATALAGLFFFSFSGLRRRKLPILLCLLLFGSVFAGMGCGSGTNNVNTSPTSGINQAGTYTVTVAVTDTNSLTEQGNFTLTIQ